VCSVKEFKVLESANAIVNPGLPLDAATLQATRLTQEAVTSQGVTLAQALDKVSEFANFRCAALGSLKSGIIWCLDLIVLVCLL